MNDKTVPAVATQEFSRLTTILSSSRFERLENLASIRESVDNYRSLFLYAPLMGGGCAFFLGLYLVNYFSNLPVFTSWLIVGVMAAFGFGIGYIFACARRTAFWLPTGKGGETVQVLFKRLSMDRADYLDPYDSARFVLPIEDILNDIERELR